MIDMRSSDTEIPMLEFLIPARGLIGYRVIFLQIQRTGIMNTTFEGYGPTRAIYNTVRPVA